MSARAPRGGPVGVIRVSLVIISDPARRKYGTQSLQRHACRVCGPLRRSVRRRPCELRRPWAYLSGAVRFAQLPLTRTPLTPILNEYKREREARMGIPFLILYLPRSPVQVHTHWGQARVGPVPLLRDQGLHRRVHTELDWWQRWDLSTRNL